MPKSNGHGQMTVSLETATWSDILKLQPQTDDKVELASLKSLLTGKTLRQIQDEINRLEKSCKESQRHLDKLLGSDRAILREELRQVLKNGKHEELPFLKQLVLAEKPRHKNVPLLMAAMQARVPVWIHGDTGSGKTTAAILAAEQLGIPHRLISVCPTTTKSEFFGYRDAGGTYHGTAFREVFEHGGVFLIDEIDNGNPSILAVLNTALANDWCAFPDGNIKRHENALFAAAANTIGRGADTRYIGRNALDATTLDRFVFVRMDIDENLEDALTTGEWKRDAVTDIAEGGPVKPKDWSAFVRDARRVCQDLGIEHIISPRANLNGQRLIAAGVGKAHLEEMCVWKGIRETDKRKIKDNLKRR